MSEVHNLKNQNYFRKGIIEIINNKNPGYFASFSSHTKNSSGIYFLKEDFKEIVESYNILFNFRILPEEFLVKIKYSPISLFKKWVFVVTNESFPSAKKANAIFRKEYFLMLINNEFNFFPISTNIAHESFLFNLYINQEVEEYNLFFQTQFKEDKKLILYKDYDKRKIFSLPLPRKFNILKNRPYNIRVSVIKNLIGARFKIKINENKIEHVIRFSKKLDNKNLELQTSISSKKNQPLKKSSPAFLSQEENQGINYYRKKVIEILKKNHNQNSKTNNFANISLGRVNRIMVLINLSKKHKEKDIHMSFNEKNETFEIYQSDKLIKTFMVSYSPKSNWLEKSKN